MFTTFDISDWDSKARILSPLQKESKTEKEVSMPFGPDADLWEIDVIYILACLLITSRSKFLPQYHSLEMINLIVQITQLEKSLMLFLKVYLTNMSPMWKFYAKE